MGSTDVVYANGRYSDPNNLFLFLAKTDKNTKDFEVSVHQQQSNPEILHVHWDIAPGLQLYKDKIQFSIQPKTHQIQLGRIDMPQGNYNNDTVIGNYQVYKNALDIQIPVKNSKNLPYSLTIDYQGCQPGRYCYPPQTQTFYFNQAQSTASKPSQEQEKTSLFTTANLTTIQHLFSEQNIPLILFSFFIFGLLLSLTPCVLPMLPILMGIVLGQKNNTAKQAFLLSLAYVLGIAISYAIAGIIAAKLGQSLQVFLQNPWVISVFSLIFIVLALSLFGAYNLQLPIKIQNSLHNINQKFRGGSYLSAAMMGMISSLVASPCLTAPLAGALVYLSSTGNQFIGGSALFSLGIGFGIPMLILGASGGKLILKAGNWMKHIKTLLGLILIAMAIWMQSRVLSDTIMPLIWGAFLVITPIALGILEPAKTLWQRIYKALGITILIVGTGLILKTLISPNINNNQTNSKQQTLNKNNNSHYFNTVYTMNQLQTALDKAKIKKQPVMVDYYASWCTTCKELDATTFKNNNVLVALKNFSIIRVDITKNDLHAKQIQQAFHVFGPPTIQFFNTHGKLIPHAEVVGYIAADNLVNKIHLVK
ncbi:protein-disulfide reductase DsbD [Piscirickettsia salmonis]|nr:protein-disulfide reductase DsbD [Piscirickettsia salmonis]